MIPYNLNEQSKQIYIKQEEDFPGLHKVSPIIISFKKITTALLEERKNLRNIQMVPT